MSMKVEESKVVQKSGQLKVMWCCVLVENGREMAKIRDVIHDEEVEDVLASLGAMTSLVLEVPS